jgi:oligosaccharyltransferase complex subunit beta
VKLEQYGEYNFDNLILFAPTADDFGGAISVKSVVGFIDAGHNVLIAANTNVTDSMRGIANECGIDFDEHQSSVVDHMLYDMSDAGGDHTLVTSTHVIDTPVIVGARGKAEDAAPILFRGVGHAANENSPLLYKVLVGSPSTYSHAPLDTVDEYPQSAGQDTRLVTALQARNNARVVFSGSLDMFSNAFFTAPAQAAGGKRFERSGNQHFCDELSKWNFGERGRIRAKELTHRRVGSTDVNPSVYRVKDDIEVSIDIFEHDIVTDTWHPFQADDVQLEFFMIDPYIRRTLTHNGKGRFSTAFRVPDNMGVFKFKLAYERNGFSNLYFEQQVSVRPFRHDEFDRFLLQAMPYYASAFSVMAAFLLFGVVFFYTDISPAAKKKAAAAAAAAKVAAAMAATKAVKAAESKED